MQGGPALALAMLPAVAAAWPSGRRFISLSTAVVAVYLGVCSYRFPDAAGAFGEAWSLLSIAWGLAITIVVVLTDRG